METREELVNLLPEKVQRVFNPGTPVPARLMAARGLLPTTPENLVLALLLLRGDPEASVASAATQSLQKMPENIMVTAINSPKAPEALMVALAPLATVSPAIAQALVLNPRAPNEVIAQLAASAGEAVCELIVTNQARLLKCPEIAVYLSRNPQALRSSVDRTFDFLVRNGVSLECKEFEEAMARLTPSDRLEMANKVDLPPELADFFENNDENEAQAAAPAAAAGATAVPEEQPAVATSQQPAAQAAAPVIAKKEEPAEELDENGKKKHIPMLKLIGTLNPAQKIALATKGNKEARAILIKDANKQVACAVINSPAITEQEVATAAASRSVNDEVIRIICKTPSMLRAYSVKVALVNNPRVPVALALRLLPTLRKNDIKLIAKSKDLPSALVKSAQRLCQS